jgi:hypothetical protein
MTTQMQLLSVELEKEQARLKAKKEARLRAEQEEARVAAVTNAPALLSAEERKLRSAMRLDKPYLRTASNQSVYIADIIRNYRKLRRLLHTLTRKELWPCVPTRTTDGQLFSAPLDVPPTLAAMLVAELRKVSTDEMPFPSAHAGSVQQTVAAQLGKRTKLATAQPYFVGPDEELVGLPAENAEVGFIRGAKLDTDIRVPFSGRKPHNASEEPPRARVAVETEKPNLTVIYTHGYFASTLTQLGVSTPASGSVAYGLYRFGIETKGRQLFQDSLVSVPHQLTVFLDLD